MIWDLDPVAFHVGTRPVTWYGCWFATALVAGFFMMEHLFRRAGLREAFESFIPYGFIGAVAGARLGHFAFYEPVRLLSDPVAVIDVIHVPGMASHGAAFGLLVMFGLYAARHRTVPLRWLLDAGAINLLLIGSFIRIGNFFNGEILGVPTAGPLGVVHAFIDPATARHPVQLYEAAFYAVACAWLYRRHVRGGKRVPGSGFALALCGVFTFRFAVEFLKLPLAAHDADAWLSTGQWLSMPLVVAGLVLFRRWARPA